MAKALIDSLAGEFDASQYRDEYRDQVLALIERKAKGEKVVAAASEEPAPTKAPDLMAALEESLASIKGEESKSKASGNGAKPATKPAAKKPAAKKPAAKKPAAKKPAAKKPAAKKPAAEADGEDS